jgi:hypothetical protein
MYSRIALMALFWQRFLYMIKIKFQNIAGSWKFSLLMQTTVAFNCALLAGLSRNKIRTQVFLILKCVIWIFAHISVCQHFHSISSLRYQIHCVSHSSLSGLCISACSGTYLFFKFSPDQSNPALLLNLAASMWEIGVTIRLFASSHKL